MDRDLLYKLRVSRTKHHLADTQYESKLCRCVDAMLFVAAILLTVMATVSAEYSCYSNNTTPYLLFGSKTAYEFVHEESTAVTHPASCEPKQFWLLTRHGTRFPLERESRNLNKYASKLHAMMVKHKDIKLCDADIALIKSWKMRAISEDMQSMLAPQGFVDMWKMAQRFQKRFPTLLGIPYEENKFVFRNTEREVTRDSARAFAVGLFGSVVPLPAPIFPDQLIETYKACPLWLNTVNQSSVATKEMKSFAAGPHMKDLIARVSERLGFHSPLELVEVNLFYKLCRYEKAWAPASLSTWCAAFTEEDLKVMEYRQDLKTFYQESYGNDINVKLGCPPVKDLIERFSFSEVERSTACQPQGVLYFSHSNEISMVLSALGLFKDSQPLTSDNYLSMQDRQWRISKIGSFASNIAAVFYECLEGERNRFQLFVEERPVSLDGCPEGELCSWAHVKQLLSKTVKECDLSFC